MNTFAIIVLYVIVHHLRRSSYYVYFLTPHVYLYHHGTHNCSIS